MEVIDHICLTHEIATSYKEFPGLWLALKWESKWKLNFLHIICASVKGLLWINSPLTSGSQEAWQGALQEVQTSTPSNQSLLYWMEMENSLKKEFFL